MFADSSALNAIDDPVYDVWLVDCRNRPTCRRSPAQPPELPARRWPHADHGAGRTDGGRDDGAATPSICRSGAAPTTRAQVFDDRG